MPTDKIEILVVRDPDMENDIRVFVNGQESDAPFVYDVDAGHGYTADDWVENYRHAQTWPGLSEGYRAWLLAALADPPGREYIDGWGDESIEELAARIDRENAEAEAQGYGERSNDDG